MDLCMHTSAILIDWLFETSKYISSSRHFVFLFLNIVNLALARHTDIVMFFFPHSATYSKTITQLRNMIRMKEIVLCSNTNGLRYQYIFLVSNAMPLNTEGSHVYQYAKLLASFLVPVWCSNVVFKSCQLFQTKNLFKAQLPTYRNYILPLHYLGALVYKSHVRTATISSTQRAT